MLLKRGGGRGRPDFTIIFRGGGGGRKKTLKSYEATQAGGGGGGINSPLQKDKKKLERKIEQLDQRKLEVKQPKIKNKSNLGEGGFFREKQESRRTVKGEKKRTSGTE